MRIDPTRVIGKATLCVVLAVALAGVPLAVAGLVRPVPVLLLTGLLAAFLWWRWDLCPCASPAAARPARLPLSWLSRSRRGFGGLWALWEAIDRPSRSASVVAGLALGGTLVARIDALLSLVLVAAFLVLECARARTSTSGQRLAHPALFAAAAVPPAAVAAVDLWLIDPFYAEDLSGEVLSLLGALAVMTLAGASVAGRGGAVARASAGLERRRAAAGWLLAGATCAIGLYAAIGRPWLVWYLGPVPVVLGFLGLTLGWREALSQRGRWPLLAFLLLVLGTATLYLLRPSIRIEQIWSVRRLLPVVIPGVLVGAFVQLEWAWERWRSRSALAAPALALLYLIVIAFPAARLAPVAGARPQFPMKHVTRDVCDRLPEDASVAVVAGGQTQPIHYLLADAYVVTLRAFCGVPAGSTPAEPALLRRAAKAVRERGRTLVIMSESWVPLPPPSGSPPALGGLVEDLERPADRAPKASHRRRVEIYLVRADEARIGSAPVQ